MRGIPSAAPNRASPQNAISMPRHSPSHPAHCTHSVTKGSAVRPPACLPALIEKQVRNTHRPALYEILTIARRSNSARPPLKCNFQCKMRFFCNSQSNTSRGATMLMDLRRLCPPPPSKARPPKETHHSANYLSRHFRTIGDFLHMACHVLCT